MIADAGNGRGKVGFPVHEVEKRKHFGLQVRMQLALLPCQFHIQGASAYRDRGIAHTVQTMVEKGDIQWGLRRIYPLEKRHQQTPQGGVGGLHA